MTIAQTIRETVEKKDYNNTVESIRKACEDVFGYKKITECSLEDVVRSKKPYLSSHLIAVEKSGYHTKIIFTNSPRLLPSADRPELTEITFDKCFHYGKSTGEGPEGVITNLTYTRTKGGVELGGGQTELPLVEVRGYGGDWLNAGDITSIPSCFFDELKIPQDILIMSKIDFEKFLTLIEKQEKS